MAWRARSPGEIASWLCCVATLLLSIPAQAEPAAYAGSYQASPAAVRSEVSAWGADCGVQPQTYTASERPSVRVSSVGSHLVVAFPARKLRTDLCWSPNPILKLASATAADNRWRAECRTPRGEAKQEVGRYTVTATGPYTLELLEESDYDWQLKGSHCVATVRITQQLERVPQERTAGEKARASDVPQAQAITAAPPPPACVAGPATRLRIRPSEARIEPSQRVCFTVQGVDATGCAADLAMGSVRWELKKPDAAQAQLADGCFRAAAGAADAEGSFRVTAVHEGLRAQATVSVVAADLADITARRAPSVPTEGPAAAAPAAAREVLDTRVQTAAVKPRDLTPLWIVLGLLGLALGGGGLLLVLRQRAKRAEPPRRSSRPAPLARDAIARPPSAPAAAPSPPVAQPAAIAAPMPAAAAPSTEPMICPMCRRGYVPGAARCENDGTGLLPYAEFVRRAKEAETAATACPKCSATLSAGSVFCGVCGCKLSY